MSKMRWHDAVLSSWEISGWWQMGRYVMVDVRKKCFDWSVMKI